MDEGCKPTKVIHIDNSLGKFTSIKRAVFCVYDAHEREKTWLAGKNYYIRKDKAVKWTEEKAKLIEEYDKEFWEASNKLIRLEKRIMEE